MRLAWMTSETSVLTDFSELNSDALSAGIVWQPWTCCHNLWHLQRYHYYGRPTHDTGKSLCPLFFHPWWCLKCQMMFQQICFSVSHSLAQERHRVGNTPGTGKLIKKEIRFYHWRSAVAQVECAAIVSGLRFMLGKSVNGCSLLFQMTATSFIIPRQVRKMLWKILTFQI